MIPLNDDLQVDFEIETQPTKTYKLDIKNNRIVGMVDGLAAVKQSVFKILETERYNYPIYTWNHGVELIELIGEQPSFAYPEVKRRITEALIQDERISGVDEFTFTSVQGAVNVKFTVHTTEGEIEMEKVVNV
jgi:phage baseplate assembly protein W